MKIKISEIEESFKKIFNEDVVTSISTVYEKPSRDDDDFLKLVISIHGLATEDTSVIHTNFIFKTDLHKHDIIDNSFIYLYGLNCVYHKIEFDNVLDMEEKINDIIESNNFSEDIIIISDFIEAPAMFLNHYMRRYDITDYSVFDVTYEPKFKHQSCDKTTFDFKININNNYHVDLSIRKVESDDEGEPDVFRFQFKFMDDVETHESPTLDNIHYFIGSNIAKMLDKKLKNK